MRSDVSVQFSQSLVASAVKFFFSLELIQRNVKWTKQTGNGKRNEGKLTLELLLAVV